MALLRRRASAVAAFADYFHFGTHLFPSIPPVTLLVQTACNKFAFGCARKDTLNVLVVGDHTVEHYSAFTQKLVWIAA